MPAPLLVTGFNRSESGFDLLDLERPGSEQQGRKAPPLRRTDWGQTRDRPLLHSKLARLAQSDSSLAFKIDLMTQWRARAPGLALRQLVALERPSPSDWNRGGKAKKIRYNSWCTAYGAASARSSPAESTASNLFRFVRRAIGLT